MMVTHTQSMVVILRGMQYQCFRQKVVGAIAAMIALEDGIAGTLNQVFGLDRGYATLGLSTTSLFGASVSETDLVFRCR